MTFNSHLFSFIVFMPEDFLFYYCFINDLKPINKLVRAADFANLKGQR